MAVNQKVNGVEIKKFGGSSHYSSFEDDGTLVMTGDATVWDDLRIIPGAFQFAGAGDPTIQNWQIGGAGTIFKVYKFDQSQAVYFVVQLPHGYKQGTDIYVHVHWTPGARGTEETTATVAWKLDASWANIDGVFGASGIYDMTDACQSTDDDHLMSPEVVIDGHTSAKNISSMLICKFYRDTGDSWVGTGADGPILLEVDFHFQMDTIGSRGQSSK